MSRLICLGLRDRYKAARDFIFRFVSVVGVGPLLMPVFAVRLVFFHGIFMLYALLLSFELCEKEHGQGVLSDAKFGMRGVFCDVL